MSLTVLFAAGAEKFGIYRTPLTEALAEAGLDARLVTEAPPAQVDYIVYAPASTLQDFRPYTAWKAVLNLWAGVERVVGNPTLSQPLCRMVDPAMTAGMTEYVAGHVLRHHLGMDRHIAGPKVWEPVDPPLACERPVAMLGLGELGRACSAALGGLGFPVLGWSRSARDIPGIECFHGAAGLEAALRRAQIVVTLLPDTPATRNLLDARRLSWLPRGAVIVNPGRGTLIDDAALLAALDSGSVGHATLDVFRTEPLPADHPFWAHPRVTVTPHVAACTRPASAARVIAENIRRAEEGAPLLHLVAPERGY